ncbi:MAG TPA: ABC transporter permease subunit, partial [Abditibacteriaceae bacterium]|nr:ABC transporter permease subunit [Abditibacteriaceae bacterium]
MQFNPILVREVRARWRGWSGFLVVFGYGALLAATLDWNWIDFELRNNNSNVDSSRRAATLGHELFRSLTWVQTLLWMLLAPALTATAIAGERERGLLDALQLANLTPRRIVGGKLLSALSFVGLMMLVQVPISATCLILGGVSPAEVGQALSLHFLTATTAASAGLACSAWSRRAGGALTGAFLLMIVWGVGSAVALPLAQYYLSFSPKPGSWFWLAALLSTCFWQTNPLIAAFSITDPTAMTGGLAKMATAFGLAGTWLDLPVWAVCLGFECAFSLFLLWWATRALKRPFAEPQWADSKPGRALWPRAQNTRRAASPARRELPLLTRVAFANPVLQREVRSKFRMRRQPFWILIIEMMVGAFALYWYVRVLWWALSRPDWREGIWMSVTMIGLVVANIATAVMGAGAFSREREAGTWEGLQLSLLSRRAIITGKLMPPLFSCAVYSLLLWPILLPCVTTLVNGNRWNVISVTQTIAAVLIVFGTAWCYTALGMWFSWRCRRTVAAVTWAMGTGLFALIFVPALLLSNSRSMPGDPLFEFLRCWHPYIALATLFDRG